MRPTTMVDRAPNERTVGIRSRLVAKDLGVFSNLPGAHPFSWPLAAERVGSCHLGSTTPVETGRGWPARTNPSEQQGVLRQCHVARRYGSAQASAGCANALGHSWRRLFFTLVYLARFFFCYWFWIHTASETSTAETHTDGGTFLPQQDINKEAPKRLARRHSRYEYYYYYYYFIFFGVMIVVWK